MPGSRAPFISSITLKRDKVPSFKEYPEDGSREADGGG